MAFEALSRAIFRQEGSLDSAGNWVVSSVGYRNNNPGNLAYAGQPGAAPLPSRDPGMPGAGLNVTYARFGTLEQGIAATQKQLALDASRGLTLAQRLATWATGNRDAYLANVSAWLGVDPGVPLASLAFHLVPPAKPGTAGPRNPAPRKTGRDHPLTPPLLKR